MQSFKQFIGESVYSSEKRSIIHPTKGERIASENAPLHRDLVSHATGENGIHYQYQAHKHGWILHHSAYNKYKNERKEVTYDLPNSPEHFDAVKNHIEKNHKDAGLVTLNVRTRSFIVVDNAKDAIRHLNHLKNS
jgi:hypothetical protein